MAWGYPSGVLSPRRSIDSAASREVPFQFRKTIASGIIPVAKRARRGRVPVGGRGHDGRAGFRIGHISDAARQKIIGTAFIRMGTSRDRAHRDGGKKRMHDHKTISL